MLVLERDTLCGGMTGKSSGIVRCHYGVPSLAAMAWYASRCSAGRRDLRHRHRIPTDRIRRRRG
ncbi:hypothetical protein GS415_06400 [Rhodococcus hoagii]|nr:hypothetical protein [Prescottella equi]